MRASWCHVDSFHLSIFSISNDDMSQVGVTLFAHTDWGTWNYLPIRLDPQIAFETEAIRGQAWKTGSKRAQSESKTSPVTIIPYVTWNWAHRANGLYLAYPILDPSNNKICYFYLRVNIVIILMHFTTNHLSLWGYTDPHGANHKQSSFDPVELLLLYKILIRFICVVFIIIHTWYRYVVLIYNII